MRNKQYLVILLLGLIIFTSFASAITATLGNSRMILRAEKGESIENFLRVINTNDIPVTIVLSVSGDSGKDFKLKDEEFSLAPKEEKRAYFTIKARSEGTFENKINVLFKPEEGNSVGLLANVILIVGNSDSNIDEEDGSDVTITGDVVQNEGDVNSSGFSFGQKNTGTSSSSFSLSPSTILIGSTGLLIIVLIVLFIFLLKRSKKEARRPRE